MKELRNPNVEESNCSPQRKRPHQKELSNRESSQGHSALKIWDFLTLVEGMQVWEEPWLGLSQLFGHRELPEKD